MEAITSFGGRVIGDPVLLRVRGQVEPVVLPGEIAAVDLDVLADVVSGFCTGARQMKARKLAARVPDVRQQRDELGGRQLLQLLARRTAARLGVRRG